MHDMYEIASKVQLKTILLFSFVLEPPVLKLNSNSSCLNERKERISSSKLYIVRSKIMWTAIEK